MTRLQNNQAGFTLIEVLTAAFVLSVAVAALFLVSTRSLMLNSQAAKLHGATLLAEDVFAAVQRTIYDNALVDDPVFGAPLAVCQGGATCQMDIDNTLNTPFSVCTAGDCDQVVRNTEGLMVQNPADVTADNQTGYEREIQMELLSSREMLVTVVIRWQDRGRAYERTYTRTFLDWYNMEAYYEYGRLIATVVECATESDLPNWSGVGPSGGIQKGTAQAYVDANPNCWLSPNWQFQWGYLNWGFEEGRGSRSNDLGWSIDETKWVDNTPLPMTGPADGSGGPGTYTYDPVADAYRDPYTNEWRTFGETDADGRTAIIIPDPTIAANFMLRVVTKPGYVPFSYFYDDDNPFTGPGDDYTAEMYCRDDVENYDNFDYIDIQPGGNVYYCIAFMAKE